MPIRNQLFGVYKLLELKSPTGNTYRPYLAETASRRRTMEVNAKNFIQGTAKNRILDIGAISETFSFKLPILVGGASDMDGRTLILDYLAAALNESSTNLPLITSASISVSSEGGATVDVEMLSDGVPSQMPFRITNRPIDSIGVGGVSQPLDPINSDRGPTRVAKFYDFRAKIGKFVYYIMEAKVVIKVNTEKKYFIAGKQTGWGDGQQFVSAAITNPLQSTSTTDGSGNLGGNNPYNFGTQFPFIGVSGITVEGSGKAAVELTDVQEDTKYDFDDYNSGPPGKYEGVNVDLTENGGEGGNNYELTWQTPGVVRTSALQAGDASEAGFALEIWDAYKSGGAGWINLFKNSSGVDVINLTKSVVKSSNFQVSTGVMTSDFEFQCWVK